VLTLKRKPFPFDRGFTDTATGEHLDAFERRCDTDGDPLKSPFTCSLCDRVLKWGSHFWRSAPALRNATRAVCNECATVTD